MHNVDNPLPPQEKQAEKAQKPATERGGVQGRCELSTPVSLLVVEKGDHTDNTRFTVGGAYPPPGSMILSSRHS